MTLSTRRHKNYDLLRLFQLDRFEDLNQVGLFQIGRHQTHLLNQIVHRLFECHICRLTIAHFHTVKSVDILTLQLMLILLLCRRRFGVLGQKLAKNAFLRKERFEVFGERG